jgi:hypothetical protein
MNSNKTEVLQGTRLRSIDALRGLAAIGVVLYHTVQRPPNGIPARLLDWPAYVVQFGSSFGYIGVFLFFVISGFCIHLQWALSSISHRAGILSSAACPHQRHYPQPIFCVRRRNAPADAAQPGSEDLLQH